MKIGVIVGTGLKPDGAVRSVPHSDRTAIALATLKLKGEVTAYSFPGDNAGLRHALAGGAASTQRLESLDEIEFDVMLVGQGGCGALGDLLPATLAENRGGALVLDVLDVEPASEAAGLRVTRDMGRGSKEILLVQVPAVLSISPNAQRLTYVSRYRQLSANPEAETRAGSVGFADPAEEDISTWELARPRTKTGALTEKTRGTAADRMNALMGATGPPETKDEEHILQADAETCSKQLLRYLAHHGFIEGREMDSHGEEEATPALPVSAPASEGPAIRAAQRKTTGRGPRKLGGDSKTSGRRPAPIRGPAPVQEKPEIERQVRKPKAVNGKRTKPSRGPRPLDS